MKKILGIVVLGFLWINPVSADERFIPLELFTGGEIREDTEIKFKLNFDFECIGINYNFLSFSLVIAFLGEKV